MTSRSSLCGLDSAIQNVYFRIHCSWNNGEMNIFFDIFDLLNPM